jgi:hypothetical protein
MDMKKETDVEEANEFELTQFNLKVQEIYKVMTLIREEYRLAFILGIVSTNSKLRLI